jgi:hypothetical protein
MSRRTWRTLGAVARVVVPAIALAEAGLLLVRGLVPQAALRGANDVLGNYLQTLGTIYAVLLAFVVFVVWTQFNDARQAVEREANELLDLYRTAHALPAGARDQLQGHLAVYADLVLAREWDAMACGDLGAFADGAALIDRVAAALRDCEPTCSAHEICYAEMLARFNDLSDARANRITAACLRVPLALRIFLYTGAVMTLGSLYLFTVETLFLHAIMSGAMAGMLSHILYVIRDLDNPFAGDWQVPRTAFTGIRERFTANAPVAVRTA